MLSFGMIEEFESFDKQISNSVEPAKGLVIFFGTRSEFNLACTMKQISFMLLGGSAVILLVAMCFVIC